jgi:molecular chaperone GrpE
MSNDQDEFHDDRDERATAPGEAQATDELELLRSELATVRQESETYRNDYLRAVAEMDNTRKRAQRDIEAAHRFGIERFALDLLEVRDSLELGIAAGASREGDPLLEGMQATLRQLDRAFEKAGVTVVDPAGEAFNPDFHEAMTTREAPEAAPGTVLDVFQKGYLLNGRLLRPARVVIAREG